MSAFCQTCQSKALETFMPIKKPHEYRPDQSSLHLIRITQEAMGRLEGGARENYQRLLNEHCSSREILGCHQASTGAG
jgi:hypothetical protein